jgi:hypothetical protein
VKHDETAHSVKVEIQTTIPVRQATKKTTFLRVKSAHFYALKKIFIRRKMIETALTVNRSTFYAKK